MTNGLARERYETCYRSDLSFTQALPMTTYARCAAGRFGTLAACGLKRRRDHWRRWLGRAHRG